MYAVFPYHAWVKKFPYTQKYMPPCSGQVFACMEISIHPKVYAVLGSSVCMHGNFHTPKSICRARVKCLHAWKFPYTQKYMPYLGQVFACMEISIHQKVYAVVFCMLGNFHTPKSVHMPCTGQLLHEFLHAGVYWKLQGKEKESSLAS